MDIPSTIALLILIRPFYYSPASCMYRYGAPIGSHMTSRGVTFPRVCSGGRMPCCGVGRNRSPTQRNGSGALGASQACTDVLRNMVGSGAPPGICRDRCDRCDRHIYVHPSKSRSSPYLPTFVKLDTGLKRDTAAHTDNNIACP